MIRYPILSIRTKDPECPTCGSTEVKIERTTSFQAGQTWYEELWECVNRHQFMRKYNTEQGVENMEIVSL